MKKEIEIISVNSLADEYSELKSWLEEMRRINIEDYMIVRRENDMIRIRFYTDSHQYAIVARLPNRGGDKYRGPDDKGYLGCYASCRKPRAGENWTRGNDLADGPYTRETWQRVMSDILAYELVKIAKPQKAR